MFCSKTFFGFSILLILVLSGCGTSFKHTNTGNSSEQVCFLNMQREPDRAYIDRSVVVYSQRLTNLRAGEVILALAEAEITVPTDEDDYRDLCDSIDHTIDYNVSVVGQLILAPTQDSVTGIEISEANGYNITPAMHHGVITKLGTLACPDNYSERHVNLIMYAASTAANPEDRVIVGKDYGRLSVLRFKQE